LSVKLAASLALLAAAASGAAGQAHAAGAPITVEVGNVRNNHGRVRVTICPQERFLNDAGCKYEGSAPAHAGTTTITIDNVPPGQWAAQAFFDENDNNKVDKMLFGIPKEGVGFSRDARMPMRAPKWEDAVFSHDGAAQTIHFSLRYFWGPDSPQAWAKAHPKG